MLARLSPDSVIPTVGQWTTELRQAAHAACPSLGLENLIKTLAEIESFCQEPVIEVDVLVPEQLDPKEAHKLAAWLSPGFPVHELTNAESRLGFELPGEGQKLPIRYRVRTVGGTLIQRAGSRRAPVLVVGYVDPSRLDLERGAALQRSLKGRPYVLVVGNEEPVKEIGKRATGAAWLVEAAMGDELGKPLPIRLRHPERLATLPILAAEGAREALSSATEALELALEHDRRAIEARRIWVTQRTERLGTARPGLPNQGPGAELVVQIKNRTQRLHTEFERGVSDRLQDFIGQPHGTLTQEIEEILRQFDNLDEEVKSSNIVTRVPREVQEGLNNLLRRRLAKHCTADLVALNDLYRLMKEDIERLVVQKLGVPMVVDLEFITEDALQRMIRAHAGFESLYRGELPRRGFSEYFSQVRRYSMILIMGASMFGLSSLMRQYRQYTVPLTILICLFGTYSVVMSTRQQRIENRDKALEMARQSMRSDIRKILAEIQKQWVTVLGQHLNEQFKRVVAEVEAQVKDHESSRSSQVETEREKLQRQLQGLAAADGHIAAATKTRDTISGNVAQMPAQLHQFLLKPLEEARKKKAAAAAKAAADAASAAARASGKPALGGARAGAPKVKMPTRPKRPDGGASDAMAKAKAKLAALKAKKRK